jgi:hypothetical protein
MKKLLFALLHSTRAIRVISWVNRKHVPILCYHSVIEGQHRAESDPHKQHIPLRLFLQHLDYLQRDHNFSLNEFNMPGVRESSVSGSHGGTHFDEASGIAFRGSSALTRRNNGFVITDRAYGSLPPNGESFLSWADSRIGRRGLTSVRTPARIPAFHLRFRK